jgi:hypothetical protein
MHAIYHFKVLITSTYRADEIGSMVPMESKISEDAFVQLLYELDIKGLSILDIREEPVNVLHAILAAPEVVVCQFAEVWALTDILEPHLPGCAHTKRNRNSYCTVVRKEEKEDQPPDVNRTAAMRPDNVIWPHHCSTNVVCIN